MSLKQHTPRISIIAAVGENRELGKKNDLIWRIPADLKRVKELTTGHPIIMGENTFKSIGKPLPNRTNIVLTLDQNYRPEGCVMALTLDEAFAKAREIEHDEIFVFGGARVYHDTISLADRLYLTLIHDTDAEADAFFPEYADFSKVVAREDFSDMTPSFSWLTLERAV